MYLIFLCNLSIDFQHLKLIHVGGGVGGPYFMGMKFGPPSVVAGKVLLSLIIYDEYRIHLYMHFHLEKSGKYFTIRCEILGITKEFYGD